MTAQPLSAHAIQALVEAELGRDDLPVARDFLASLLVPPRPLTLAWDYGKPGEAFPVWVVATSPDGLTAFVYCTEGFGPKSPWGMVFPEDGNIGMDSQWHDRLADAVICAGLAKRRRA